MFEVYNGNKIRLTKGNTVTIDITPIDEETQDPIILVDNDKVLFTIKTSGGRTMLQKTLTKDDYSDEHDTSVNCVIDASDTIDWETGIYYYDCLLYLTNGDIVTFISSTIQILPALGKYTDVG